MLELAIVENVQREDLNPIERAQAFQRLIDEFGLPITDIAKRVGKSESYVSNSMRLLNLPDAIKDGLMSGAISEGHARAIAGLNDTKLMVEAYKTILAENASVRAAEELARKIKSKSHQAPVRRVEKIHSDELEEMQDRLKELLAAQAKIVQTAVQARVSITFNGNVEKTSKQIRELLGKIGQ
jgi:ParB family chromosome partitioning protein